MNPEKFSQSFLARIRQPRITAFIERLLRKMPLVQNKMEESYQGMLGDLERSIRPYHGILPTFRRLPVSRVERPQVLEWMEMMRQNEEGRWRDGFVSGAVYHGDQEHIDFLNRVYALSSQSNPLHADVWPSATKFDAEIVAMTANMLGAAAVNEGPEAGHICGTVTSGGTESIMLAMRAYMRSKTVDGLLDESLAERVGLTPRRIEEMYHVMAIANYEDRFVIPTAHREVGEDAYNLRGSCGFSFGNGCSEGISGGNLFGAPRTKTRTPTEVM